MKLSINLFMTLDGVSQSPGSPEEDPRGGFTRGGWLMPVFDEGCGRAVGEWYSHTSALLLGRTTYNTFSSHWPQITDPEDRVASQINNGQKYVVTSGSVADVWADTTTVLGKDFLHRVRELKAQPGDELQVHGSIQLARTLHQAGLVDIYRFLIAPVLVGEGASVFGPENPASTMTVTSSTVTDSGVVSLELTPGEFSQAAAVVEDGKDSIRQD
ncbi:dihydrofolate reductase family protein [Nesterenkonia natronophila]|uniref:Dihydrofolate reductase n=1 Tax=Nesterenkonia natronophila TaxID=2174932 RepID=A0A3A4G2E4_9MICC|nr:dihydrofolate reductase family protein [Nesterenkonia natronophila]RJN32339.1 dihydrofolate reductase [Nesterenkonia natronophila]